MALRASAFPVRQTVPMAHFGPCRMNGASSIIMSGINATSTILDCSNFRKVGFAFRIAGSSGAGAGCAINIGFGASPAGPFYDVLAISTAAGEPYSYVRPLGATSEIMHVWNVVGPYAQISLGAQATSKMLFDSFKWFGIS